MSKKKTFEKAYVLTVDMGYGHQRAVYPLTDIAATPVGWDSAHGNIITANKYPGIPKADKARWEGGRGIYERISRMKKLPIIGKYIFGAMDAMQRIQPFYPKRDLTKPSLQLQQLYGMVEKGWGKHLIDLLNKKPLPLITSFFTTAYFAEVHDYKGDIYVICTDTDINRAWVSPKPSESRIHYLAPNKRVAGRLQLYGVPEERITITGFPLPKENIGGRKSVSVLKKNLGERLCHLDPNGRYRKKYEKTLEHYLGKQHCSIVSERPLTIAFAVGGAGAQREIGVTILHSLAGHIREGKVKLNLVAGARSEVYDYFAQAVAEMNFTAEEEKNVHIVYDQNKLEYFQKFNKALMTTDILWTKPSELSFYAGLGLPIIMSPTVGSQEDFNKAWLHAIGAGVEQEDPAYTHEWLFDWLESGWLAQAAMEGFMDAPRNGAYHVEETVLKGKKSQIEDMHLL